MVNQFRDRGKLDGIPGFPVAAIRAFNRRLKYCELGAVSPDYPYLGLTNSAKNWADLMHYTRTGEMIHSGIRRVKSLTGDAKEKGLAWLMGYAAHVTTDVTIHPVVELKVGAYQGNERAHRICEMHQDAYIFQRMDLGEIGLSNFFSSGIATCSAPDNPMHLDRDITALWDGMLRDVHLEEYTDNVPDMDRWHEGFQVGIGEIASEGYHLVPLARHVTVKAGLTYPAPDSVDDQFIRGLVTPLGLEDYDNIFNRAAGNVANVWKTIASGVFSEDSTYLAMIGDWNLDTGRNDDNRLVFWG
jgi:hypothetical protein